MIRKYLDDIIENLFTSPVVSSFDIKRQEAEEDEGYIRVKCILSNGDNLEFSEYVEIQKNKVSIITYCYHWQNRERELIKRWDNVAHHKKINTFPHHLHLHTGKVIESRPMTLSNVLKVLEKASAINLNEE